MGGCGRCDGDDAGLSQQRYRQHMMAQMLMLTPAEIAAVALPNFILPSSRCRVCRLRDCHLAYLATKRETMLEISSASPQTINFR